MTGEQRLAAAAVQIETRPGRLAENLAQAETLATEAFSGGAKLVALPEFFPSPVITSADAYLKCRADAYMGVLPPENPALDLMKSLARRCNGFIGGSMLIAQHGDVTNRYHFVQPDGQVFTHDKDLPTMWENAFYVGGRDDGVFDTALGKIGAAMCWELVREQTVRRLAGRAELAITGTHWWGLAENWPFARSLFGPLEQYNRYLSEQAPVEFARHLGVPVIQASHAGPIQGDFYLLPGLDWRVPYVTRFVGATQIVDARGKVLASRSTAEGPGIVHAEISPGAVDNPAPLTGRFWIPRLPLFHRLYWQHQNWVCRGHYRRYGRSRGQAAAEAHAREDQAAGPS